MMIASVNSVVDGHFVNPFYQVSKHLRAKLMFGSTYGVEEWLRILNETFFYIKIEWIPTRDDYQRQFESYTFYRRKDLHTAIMLTMEEQQ
jgi:hypothetical protein